MKTITINCMDYQDLSLIEIGQQKCNPLYSFGPFMRNEYIFHYILSGKGYFEILDNNSDVTHFSAAESNIHDNGAVSKRMIPIKAGEGFLIEPHTKHLYYADEHDPWHYIWVVFKGLSVPQYLHKCGISQNNFAYYPKDYNIQTSQKIRSHLLSIIENPNADSSYLIGHFSLFFSELINNSKWQNIPNPATPKHYALTNHYISQAILYIQRNYCQIRSLDEIAVFCHVSLSHLGRLFRESLHMSLQEYLIQHRLNKAKELLSTTTNSIGEIAIMVGYQNELNLLRAFKKAYGVSPNTWRKQNRM